MSRDCLKKFEDHYLIDSFLKKISKEYSSLTDFRGKKGELCKKLIDALNCRVEFKDAKYYVRLNDTKDYCLLLNNFSLLNPSITLYVVGKTTKELSSDYFKIIKDSKHKKLAVKRQTIDPNFSSLKEFLEVSIKEVRKLIFLE